MLKLNDDQKFEAIKYRHEDQAKLLIEMSHIDLKVITSFLTLQIVFGGFISQFPFNGLSTKIGLLLIDIVFCGICSLLLRNNYERRKEVVNTIKNCNMALGYNIPGSYIQGTINASTKFRPWFYWYVIGIWVSCAGIALIIFFSANKDYGLEQKKHVVETMDKPAEQRLNMVETTVRPSYCDRPAFPSASQGDAAN